MLFVKVNMDELMMVLQFNVNVPLRISFNYVNRFVKVYIK